jgi:hypothetical protein
MLTIVTTVNLYKEKRENSLEQEMRGGRGDVICLSRTVIYSLVIHENPVNKNVSEIKNLPALATAK